MKKKNRTFGEFLVISVQQDRKRIKMRIQEIDNHISELLNLPTQPIQTKYRLDKEKEKLKRVLRNNGF